LPVHQTAIRVLLVGEPREGRWLRELLDSQETIQFRVARASGLEVAAQCMARETVDVMLLGVGTNRSVARAAVEAARIVTPSVPVIILSETEDDSLAVELLQNGAQDFLAKSRLDPPSLARSLRYSIERYRLQKTDHTLSLHDDLTGLHNHRGFRLLAEQHLCTIRRKGTGLLIYIDLDGLKQINDSYGHVEGNHALLMAADVLRSSFRQSDIVGRLGGDEFCVLMTDARQFTPLQVRKRLQQGTDLANSKSPAPFRLSISVGIADVPAASRAMLEDLLKRADAMMYEQKRHKRARTSSLLPARNSTSA
jgi:two-component system, cell cycle response regulator